MGMDDAWLMMMEMSLKITEGNGEARKKCILASCMHLSEWKRKENKFKF